MAYCYNITFKLLFMKRLKTLKLNGRIDLLNDQAMKLVKGGDYGTGGGTLWCRYDSYNERHATGCIMSVNTAAAFCQFWWAAGYYCECHSC
jgi:hypothetical protein